MQMLFSIDRKDFTNFLRGVSTTLDVGRNRLRPRSTLHEPGLGIGLEESDFSKDSVLTVESCVISEDRKPCVL